MKGVIVDVVEIIDVSSWKPYEGNPDGSGRSEKQWLVSDDGRIGSISYLIVGDGEALVEGLQFILGQHPHYDSDRLYDPSSHEHYSISHIFNSLGYEEFTEYWIGMLLFDFIIGNSDRHQSNWAYILSQKQDSEGTIIQIRPSPLYDNGSSLCCFVKEDQLQGYLGKDTLRFHSLVETKSRSLVRIDPHVKSRPLHSEVVKYLLTSYPSARPMAESCCNKLDQDAIHSLVYAYQDELVSPDRKRLLVKFLREKAALLQRLVMESEDELQQS